MLWPAAALKSFLQAIRHTGDGEYGEAGIETLEALVAPVLLRYASMAPLVLDVADGADGAYQLADPTMTAKSIGSEGEPNDRARRRNPGSGARSSSTVFGGLRRLSSRACRQRHHRSNGGEEMSNEVV